MNLSSFARRRFALSGVALATLFVSGCASSLLNLSSPSEFTEKLMADITGDRPQHIKKETDNDFKTKIATPLLSEYINLGGNSLIPLRGVGLVVGLDGTGGDPPPSFQRRALLEEMKKRKVPNPQQLLASRRTALVMLTAYLPPMVRKGQKFDVRVTLPPNSEATSLRGGRLLETRLAEERVITGRGNIRGHNYGVAQGAILTALGTDVDTADSKVMLRRGSIPGGAVSTTERDLEINIRSDKRSLKTSRTIENAISARFSTYDNYGQRVPMAEAKTDLLLELIMHPHYRNNFPRYNKVIRKIPLRESEIARRLRTEKLANELLVPETAEEASLRLEAIGKDSIPFLKPGLASDSLEVRFHTALSLAYMGDSSGVDVLQQAALEEPAFRVYSLVALSVIPDAKAIMALRQLMDSDDLELRYGALRALKENNPSDSKLGTQKYKNGLIVHTIDSDGPQAAHIVRRRAPEVVLFGRDQTLQLPTVLNVGNHLRVIGRVGQSKVEVTKYVLGDEPERRTVSTRLIDVIKAVAEMGATYPDIAQMLIEAEEQHNLPGELGIDRLPQAGRVFKRAIGSGNTQKVKIGAEGRTPDLFDRIDPSDREAPEEESSALERMLNAVEPEEDDEQDVPAEATTAFADSLDEPEEVETGGAVEMAQPVFLQDESNDESVSETNEGDFAREQHSFKEPLGSKVKRFFKSPFGQKSSL